ncbi:hypothetical protein PB31_60 [Pseudomonas phage vB_PaeM_B31]|uniref:hypothetical protein n=1 Tax=Pseudomonas phage vB_PaeM_B31 TaxID=3022055 RepID=UPI0024416369|nr:hypothetical protein QE333_gp060 [Pseudomonas phage vB_PaeM_B31]WBW49092.1 hypothetical protein PB31_60 [Pseudomonas phage vB_PaeM_B31]
MEEKKMNRYAYWLSNIKEFVSKLDITDDEKKARVDELAGWYERRVLHRIKREEYEAI